MNQMIVDILTGAIQVTIAFVLITQSFPARFSGFRDHMALAAAFLLCLIWQSLYAFIDIRFPPNIAPILVCCFLYARISRTGAWYMHLLIPALFTAAAGAITVGVLGALSLFFGIDAQAFSTNMDTRLIATAVMLLLYLPFVYLLTNLARRWTSHRSQPITSFAFTLVIPVMIIGVLLMLVDAQYSDAQPFALRLPLFIAIGMIALNVIVIWLFDRMAKQSAEAARLRTEAYLANIQMRYQKDMDDIYQQMRMWRHDSHNHVQTMLALLEMNKIEELAAYMQEYATNSSSIEQFISSGNATLDALLSAKKAITVQKGINFEVQLRLPANLPLSDTDMCILLGNLLDNAIEACERMNEVEERYIYLLLETEDMHLRISLENSTNGHVRQIGSVFHTTKEDWQSHGFGLYTVNRIVEGHNGYCEYTHSNNVFRNTILLPLRAVAKADVTTGDTSR